MDLYIQQGAPLNITKIKYMNTNLNAALVVISFVLGLCVYASGSHFLGCLVGVVGWVFVFLYSVEANNRN